MPSVDVVVIGAGIMGASAAYHLAKAGLRVVVLERRSQPGEGSTLRATGGYRAQFGTAINVQLSLLSRQKLLEFEDETGVNPGYQPCGYLFLAGSEEQIEELRRGLSTQHGAGLPEACEVSSAEIAEINPWIRMDGIAGGSFCATDGFIRPANLLRGYIEAAQRVGWNSSITLQIGSRCSSKAKSPAYVRRSRPMPPSKSSMLVGLGPPRSAKSSG